MVRLSLFSGLVFIASCLLPRVALATSDTTAYATPDPPPTLLGRGHTMVDPVFGSTVVQLSDVTDGVVSVGHSYSSHFVMNYNSTYFIGLYNDIAGIGVWKTTPFNPTTYAVSASTTISPTALDPIRWDVSGTRNNIAYYSSPGSQASNRQIREWDASTHSATLIKDFEVALRRSGTVTTGTNSTHFAASAFVSPVTDMVTHFEVGQVITFTSGALNGQSQSITAFTDAGASFTTNAFTGTPGVGDTFYVRPAGFITDFSVSPDGRYFTIGLSQFGGQDTGHVLCAWDRTLDLTYVHYFTRADFGGASECPTTCGWHQMQIDKAPGSHYVWASINSAADVLIDFIAGTLVYRDANAFGHADTSVTGNIAYAGGVDPLAKVAYNATANPSTVVDVLTGVTKGGLTGSLTDRFVSQSLDATKMLVSANLNPGGSQAVSNANFVADGPPIYRLDNFTTQLSAILPLTPTNLGEVWDNQAKLTYMGTTKASIVAAGQWAFDSTGSSGKGQLWVRGTADSDLTISHDTNGHWISAFDWRLFMDEITLVYTDELPGNTQKWTRLAKAFSRVSGQGASGTSWSPRANLSPDGHFAVFTSTWGNRTRRDLFAVVIGAAPTPDPPAAPSGLTISSDGTLVWPPSTDATLAGYHVYRGTSPGVYTTRFDRTSALATAQHSPICRLIDHPSVAGTYYYIVAAFLNNGNESTPSAEVSRVVVGQTARAARQ